MGPSWAPRLHARESAVSSARPSPPALRLGPAAELGSNPHRMNETEPMLNYSPMTNYDRILSEAKTLLTEDERRKLHLALAPDEMDAAERGALEQAIEEGFEDFEKGNYSSARELSKQLLARA